MRAKHVLIAGGAAQPWWRVNVYKRYLVESIRKFPTQERFCDMIQEAGFGLVTHENLSMGIAAIHSGFKMPE